MDETTLVMSCDGVDLPMARLRPLPAFIAKRAEAYLKSSGLGDTAYFGPDPEFFIFDSVNWQVDMSGCFCKVNPKKLLGLRRKIRWRHTGHRPPSRALFSRCPG